MTLPEAITSATVIVGRACPTMARTRGRIVNARTLFSKGAVTESRSASLIDSNQPQKAPTPRGSSSLPTTRRRKIWVGQTDRNFTEGVVPRMDERGQNCSKMSSARAPHALLQKFLNNPRRF